MIVVLPRDRRQIWAQKEDGSLQKDSKHSANETARHHILLRNLQVTCPFSQWQQLYYSLHIMNLYVMLIWKGKLSIVCVQTISLIDFVINDECTFGEGQIAEEGTSRAE